MLLVSCSSLTDPDNGMIACSLGDDGVPSYEDTCSFTCNTGYVLTGSDTRTCQSDRMWNGSQPMCLGMKLNDITIIGSDIQYVTRFYKTDPNRTSGKIKLTPLVDSHTIVLLVLTLSTTQTTRDWF